MANYALMFTFLLSGHLIFFGIQRKPIYNKVCEEAVTDRLKLTGSSKGFIPRINEMYGICVSVISTDVRMTVFSAACVVKDQ